MKNSHKQTKFIAAIVAVLSVIVKIVFRVEIKGLENLPTSGGVVFCSNHISFVDPVFWLVKTKKRICFMAKAELFKFKPLAWLLGKAGAFAVDRGGNTTGPVEHAIEIVKNGGILGIFPEGTRSKDNKPKRAKAGTAFIANETGADVVPMAIVVKDKVKPFCKVKLIIGKPIAHEEIHFEGRDRQGLKQATTKIMDEITALWEMGQNEF